MPPTGFKPTFPEKNRPQTRLRPRGHWTGVTAAYSSETVAYAPEYRLSYLFEKTLNFICEYRKELINPSLHKLNYLKLCTIDIKGNTETPRSAQLCPLLF